DSTALQQAIQDLSDQGVLFVASAGNGGGDLIGDDIDAPGQIQRPAGYAYDNIISVAATDRNDVLASFSNYGSISVDLAAPGVDVYSTTRNNTYGLLSGTSMATPY